MVLVVGIGTGTGTDISIPTTSPLIGNTQYTITVFAYDNTACIGGPVYSATS